MVQVAQTFTLDTTARAMHLVVDPYLRKIGSPPRVGRSRVREVLRQIANDGWPDDVRFDPERVTYWRRWLIEQRVFTEDQEP